MTTRVKKDSDWDLLAMYVVWVFLSAVIVFGTYNPSGYSLSHWFAGEAENWDGNYSLPVIAAIAAVLVVWVFFFYKILRLRRRAYYITAAIVVLAAIAFMWMRSRGYDTSYSFLVYAAEVALTLLLAGAVVSTSTRRRR